MATAAVKTIWRKKDIVGGGVMMRPMKSASDEDRSGGDSPRRTGGQQQKHRSSQSAAPGASFGPPIPPKVRSGGGGGGGGVVKNRGSAGAVVERREKPMLLMTATDIVRLKPSQSKSSSPERTNSAVNQRKSPELPPYIRATIAEQLAPVRSRPAREDTKENLFGWDKNPRLRLSAVRCQENTQQTLFGEPEPLLATYKSSSPRHLADTKRNLFGPPPEVAIRVKSSRQRADTPDILSHEVKPMSEVRENQLRTIVSRYLLRHQDTHQKLFGAPETQRKPPPPKTTSNIFYQDQETNQDKAVKSLPLGSSLIVVTRDALALAVVVQPPGSPPPQEVGQN